MQQQLSLELFVPDRFEPLRDRAKTQLNTIVEPVESALEALDEVFDDMHSAGRGAFVVLYGDSGTGKSTFLHTVKFFRQGVSAVSIDPKEGVESAIRRLSASTDRLRLVVIEEREALKDIPSEELERDLHAINGFVRTPNGRNTIVVWPCNTKGLRDQLVKIADNIGSDALLGVDRDAINFSGPAQDQYRKIAENTIATLNQGAALIELGIADGEMEELIVASPTVGQLLGKLRGTINKKKNRVSKLLKTERCKLWIVVVAGNEPVGEVSALARGSYSALDIERMMTATEANIVKQLKEYPDKIGILSTSLDAKIFYLPVVAALEIVRTFADEKLREKMKKQGLSGKPSTVDTIRERLKKTELGRMFTTGTQGTMARGAKPKSHTLEAFAKLVAIAKDDDIAVNLAIAKGLKAVGLINAYDIEKDLGGGLKRRTDIFCETGSGIVRIEMMWRSSASRSGIANYSLTKLHNYGKALSFF